VFELVVRLLLQRMFVITLVCT